MALSQAKVKGRKIGTWLVSISIILTTVLILRRLIQDQINLYGFSWKLELPSGFLKSSEGRAGVFVSPQAPLQHPFGRKHGAVFFIVDMVDVLVDKCQHRQLVKNQ